MIWNIGLTKGNKPKLMLFLGILLSAMLLPSFPTIGNLPRIRLDEILLFGAFGINMLVLLSRGFKFNPDDLAAYRNRQGPAMRAVNRVFLILTGCIIISNIYAAIFLQGSFSFRDLMEFVTIAKYYLVIALVVALDIGVAEYKLIGKVFLAGLAVLMLLSWGQFLNPGNMNAWLTPFFAPSHLDNLVNANPPRVLGTFDNPNVMGIFSVFTLCLVTSWYYFRTNGRQSAVLLLVLAGLTIKMTFLTISRTALLGTAAVLCWLSLWALFRFRWNKGILIKVGLLFVLTILIFVTSPRDFTARINEATNVDKSTSAIGHLERWGSAWPAIEQSPVLGWGTAKNSMTTLVDDEYMLVTRRYGFVGLLAYLWLFLRPAWSAWRRARRAGSAANGAASGEDRDISRRAAGAGANAFPTPDSDFRDPASGFRPPVSVLLAYAFTAATVAVFIYDVTAGIFYNLQLMTLYAIFMGLIYRSERETV